MESRCTSGHDEAVRERIFPNWDMALMSADDIKEVLGDALRTAR